MQGRYHVIQSGHPLRHAVIVSVFRLEQELEKPMEQWVAAASDTDIGAEISQGRSSIPDEAQSSLLICGNRTRSSVNQLDNLVVEKRRAHSKLSLLQSQDAEVVPGRLAEGDKGNGVCLLAAVVRFLSSMEFRRHVRLEKAANRLCSLEHN